MLTLSPFIVFLTAGILLVVTELLVFQLSVFWIIFLGAGALVAAGFAYIAPEAGWMATTAVFVVATIVVAAGSYRPLKRWQNQPAAMPGHDAIGQQVEVLTPISIGEPGTVSWSGTDWRAELDVQSEGALQPGSQATIVKLDGITLTVR